MKRAQHEKSATLKKCNMGILEAQPRALQTSKMDSFARMFNSIVGKSY